uniref:Adhesion G protein-coupled receptor E8 n=1 Tax=Esox lucius TaxID=8010 RepID=A0AAY5KX81_ESOLU
DSKGEWCCQNINNPNLKYSVKNVSFIAFVNTIRCNNIDECVETPNICGSNSNCTNLPGTYNCSCLEGYAPSNPALAFNPSNNPCTGMLHRTRMHTETFTEPFTSMTVQSEYVNECLDIHKACGYYASCTNTPGSHTCTCYTGFQPDGPFNCQDIDECLNSTICGPNSVCNNTPGSYNCSCLIGFTPQNSNAQQPSKTNPCIGTILSPLFSFSSHRDLTRCCLKCTASAVFMTVIGMENILSASFFSTPNNTEMFSDIVTATLPKINHTQLSEPVNFTMSHKRVLTEPGLMTCVYWDDNGTDEGNQSWSVDGCWVSYSDENYTVCSCSHLSTFALIMQTIKVQLDNPFLDLVNNVCVVVGLVFLALAILTFLLCNWNPKINNTARLHLCICLFLCQLFFLLKYTYVNHKVSLVCSVMAGLLHFLVVASFMWMLLEALQLHQLVRRLSKIQVIQRDGLQKKYLYLIGYGIPLVIVGVSVAVRPDGYGGTTVCWLKPDKSFTWASLGPVCVILAVSLLFCVTIWSLRPTLASMKSDVSQSKDTRLIIFKILAQFVILGCTWVLGLFQSTIFFKYLFIVLNSQQGTFLYIVHCLFNQEVRSDVLLSKSLSEIWFLTRNASRTCNEPLNINTGQSQKCSISINHYIPVSKISLCQAQDTRSTGKLWKKLIK